MSPCTMCRISPAPADSGVSGCIVHQQVHAAELEIRYQQVHVAEPELLDHGLCVGE
jgi:hypothetical protein